MTYLVSAMVSTEDFKARTPVPTIFTADHPFHFVLLNELAFNTVLFKGRLQYPTTVF